jgi:DNA-binding MarR family transcriptional regulator
MKNMSIGIILNGNDPLRITTYQAGVLQAKMHRALQKQCDLILNTFGKMQWLIIGSVLDSGEEGVRLTELAETLGTTMSYITSAINLLEVKGMVIRKDSDIDNRSKFISINSSFVPECKIIEATLREGLRKSIYASVKPDDFKTYMKVLFQLVNVAKE